MMMRTISFVVALLLIFIQVTPSKDENGDLDYGQVYGSAGFLSSEEFGTMTDAPAAVLAFSAEDGRRFLVLTDKAGDYIALLQPGHYCLAAYTRTGKKLQLGKTQLKCVDVEKGKDLRLDVMLLPRKK